MRPRTGLRCAAAFAASAAVMGLIACGAPPAAPIRVLLLSGQNNHDWKTTTPKLEAILEEDGRFEVDVTESPGGLTSSSLEPYDVILSNWNAYRERGLRPPLGPRKPGGPPSNSSGAARVISSSTPAARRSKAGTTTRG